MRWPVQPGFELLLNATFNIMIHWTGGSTHCMSWMFHAGSIPLIFHASGSTE